MLLQPGGEVEFGQEVGRVRPLRTSGFEIDQAETVDPGEELVTGYAGVRERRQFQSERPRGGGKDKKGQDESSVHCHSCALESGVWHRVK